MVQSNKKSPRTRKRVGLELHLTCSKNEILVVLIVLVKISLIQYLSSPKTSEKQTQ